MTSEQPHTEMTREDVDAELTRATLRWLVDNTEDDVLRDLARDVLAGNVTLGGALRSLAYGDHLSCLIEPMLDDPDLLTERWVASHADTIAEFEANMAEQHNITLRD